MTTSLETTMIGEETFTFHIIPSFATTIKIHAPYYLSYGKFVLKQLWGHRNYSTVPLSLLTAVPRNRMG